MPNPSLPAELLDHIVDHLHGRKEVLVKCCLVSKSWIPRTRECLFSDIRFKSKEDVESWRETFPDPSTSPARYAKTLLLDYTNIVMSGDAESSGWIRGFSRIVHLEVISRSVYTDESQAPSSHSPDSPPPSGLSAQTSPHFPLRGFSTSSSHSLSLRT